MKRIVKNRIVATAVKKRRVATHRERAQLAGHFMLDFRPGRKVVILRKVQNAARRKNRGRLLAYSYIMM